MLTKQIRFLKNSPLTKILQHQFSNSPLRFKETCIYALASGSQRSGLAVVRLSGKSSYDVLEKMTGKSADKLYEPRKMYLKEIIHPVTKDKIDKGLVVWFKGTSNLLIFKLDLKLMKKYMKSLIALLAKTCASFMFMVDQL